jgi:hypothetical protein
MAGGLATLTMTRQTLFSWTAGASPGQGGYYGQNGNSTRIQKNFSLTQGIANNLAGGCDQFTSFQQGIMAGGSFTCDMYAFTSIFGAAVNSARNKGHLLRLLSATDDPTITPAPTVTSTVTVTNNGPAVPHPLNFASKGSGLTITITVSSGALSTTAIGAAGSGYLPSATFIVTVNQTGGSGGVVYVTTNSSGVPTAVAVAAAGSGYSAGTLPTTELGNLSLNTGDYEDYLDTSATGVTTSTTKRNFKIVNNDAVNAVTVEIDLPLPTS